MYIIIFSLSLLCSPEMKGKACVYEMEKENCMERKDLN
jgi:hypothetical protein